MLDASIGIHPHEAKLATEEDFLLLNELAKQPEVVAWGEIGLDFHYHHSPREIQEQVFIRQLGLARENHLPVIIHTREAEDRTLQILREYWDDCRLGGIMHCFSGSLDLAQECLDMGLLISFSGILTFPKSRTVQQVARIVPEHRILIETDCPYLAPVPHRGRRNEPAFVVQTAGALAEIKGLSLETVGRLTTENYLRFSKRESQRNSSREAPPPV
jgi:TatD DNase family protein